MFYTSYFSNVDKLPKEMVLISISLWSPKDWKGWKLRSLAPTQEILVEYKRRPDVKRYTERYENEVLGAKDCKLLVDSLNAKFKGKDICFLCYEKSGFCHRHLVADWLEANGYDCEEW